MRKRVLVGREDPDTPGEIAWEAEREDHPDDATKVWIGKVSSVGSVILSFENDVISCRCLLCFVLLSVSFVDYKTKIYTTLTNALTIQEATSLSTAPKRS
jgi:hypothetical protein